LPELDLTTPVEHVPEHTVEDPAGTDHRPAQADVQVPVHTILPSRRRMRLPEVWASWRVSRVLAVRDFKVMYKQSALGPLWLLIQPLGILGAFTVVFHGVASVDTAGIPYALFALVGVTVWTFVQTAISSGTRAIIINKKLVKNVACPRLPFATASVAAAIPNLLLPLLLTLAGVFVLGRSLPLNALLLPACIAWLLFLVWSLVLLFSATNVPFRDVTSVVPFLLQGAIFLTPVAYPLSEAPSTLAALLHLNPFTGLIEFWRWSLLGSDVDTVVVGAALVETLVIAVAGWQVFTRLEPRFADVI
jgi:ABC-type polysaccharide/polyol phosphate export permease